MIGDAGLEGLPGGDDGLLGFIFRLERQGLAGILAILYAGAGWASFLTSKSDFVIDEQAPCRTTLDPDAEDMDFVTCKSISLRRGPREQERLGKKRSNPFLPFPK